ncbi:MAG TPA: hypothetical protein VFM32_04870, partial [Spongiibacteraceae bacterium]|nr:hypothetical protein [Spongiibacteraceae bacterium]
NELSVLCTRICAPNDYRELAQLAIAQIPAIQTTKSADSAFAIIEQSDALRRPQRFDLLLEVALALQIAEITVARFRHALSTTLAITAQPLLERGLSGKQLGEAMRRERLAAIQREWT